MGSNVVPDCPGQFVPVFSTEEGLVEGMRFIGITRYKIKKSDDPYETIASLKEQGVRIMLDPHIVDGKTRWTELGRVDDEKEMKDRPERREIKGEEMSVADEVKEAYCDCIEWTEETQERRQTSFRASQPVSPKEAKKILLEAGADSYNGFEADILDKFPDSCEITIAREGSVCLYVSGENVPSYEEIGCDEYTTNDGSGPVSKFYPRPGETRMWWD